MGAQRLQIKAAGGPIPADCGVCPIRDHAVCALCDSDELNALNAIKSYKTYAPGEEILSAGETWDYVGSIVSGVVKLSNYLSDGRRQMVGLLFPSDFVGRSSDRPSDCDATAGVETVLCRFRRVPFEKLLHETPHIEQRLREKTQDELDAARSHMLLLGRKTAKERVSSFLLLLLRRSGGGPLGKSATVARIPLSRDDMADYLGLTIETVSRRMTELKKAGVIELSDARTFRVLDFEALRDAANDEDLDPGP